MLLADVTSPINAAEVTSPVNAADVSSPVNAAEVSSPVNAAEVTSPVITAEVSSPVNAADVISPVNAADVTSPVNAAEVTSLINIPDIHFAVSTDVNSPVTTDFKIPSACNKTRSQPKAYTTPAAAKTKASLTQKTVRSTFQFKQWAGRLRGELALLHPQLSAVELEDKLKEELWALLPKKSIKISVCDFATNEF
ncbi:hypothetical protein HAZT_HAZT008401 [Hyalella azteca]|uniref:Uncharacterized protein n=1 Tax=Hyalella azteca TaxID=294128 RepID=A0A6A0H7U4_HYAAZ|nr:hypothetical protein HAZT_HAZT008401 [Hyalella azteca]